MPQSLVTANGNLLVSLNENLEIQDFFYPHIGQENHAHFGDPFKIGIWVDGHFSWLNKVTWDIDIKYKPATLVGSSTAVNNELEVELVFADFVYTTHDIFFRQVQIKNLASVSRNFRLFFHHDFYIYGDKMQDTAQYEPDLDAVLHYRQRRYFLTGGKWAKSGAPLSDFTTGKAKYYGKEGTWKDAEDGHLHKHVIEQGSVDSTIAFEADIKAAESEVCWNWVIAAKNYDDVVYMHERILKLGPDKIREHTEGYWQEWAHKEHLDLSCVTSKVESSFYQSLLLIRSQIDNRGAIIASTDSDIMKFNKDTYAYCWPRDAGLICNALSRADCYEPVREFLFFSTKLLTEEGFVWPKYTPDGSIGSTWHPKFKDGKKQFPIQEDGSALLLIALLKFYEGARQTEVVQKLFNDYVLPLGNFILEHRDPKTGLPRPGYDPWEEQYGIFSYTAATAYAGLKAASELAKVTGHYETAARFDGSAEDLRKALIKYLYCETLGRFVKKIDIKPDGSIVLDGTVDASLYFLWDLGVLPKEDPRMQQTMQAIEDQLWVQTQVGGVARYEGDNYHRNFDHPDQSFPGNPWIITTLWLANWKLAQAGTLEDLEGVKTLLDWAADQGNAAHILPEQVDAHAGQSLSVGPLTWSHATFVDSVLRYHEKYTELQMS